MFQLEENLLYDDEIRVRMRDSYTPSDFQLEILELSFEQFRSDTNIKDIIQKDYRKLKNDDNATLSDQAMHSRLEFYYNFRTRTREWYKNGIKNLKFNVCECKRKNAGKELTVANSEGLDTTNQPSKSKNSLHINTEPTEFQKEIIAMDYETFVNETNIRDLVIRDFHNTFKGSKQIDEKSIESGLQQYDRFRKKFHRWHQNSLIDLKYKKCECKRTKHFDDKSVETDIHEVRDVEIQCSSEVDDGQQQEQKHQPATTSLQVHGLSESQILHVFYVTPTSETIELDQQFEIRIQEQPEEQPEEHSEEQLEEQNQQQDQQLDGTQQNTTGK